MENDKKKNIVVAASPIPEFIQKMSGLEKAESSNDFSFVIKAAESKPKKPIRIAFTEDPNSSDQFAGLYKTKRGLLPDSILKQIRIQNHLIASILRSRGNVMALHGQIRKDRFDIGITVDIKPEFKIVMKPDQYQKVHERIERFKKILINCGHTEGLDSSEHMSLSQFFEIQTINGLTFGRFATDIVYEEGEEGEDGHKKFHRFRPVDVGTIYKAIGSAEDGKNLRKNAVAALKKLQNIDPNIKIDISALEEDAFKYIQVINGVPKMAFTADELIVYDLYPSSDIEHNGYPVTPIDTCIGNIITHLSIDAYNKLYFQNGRAAKGAVVIRSDEIDQNAIAQFRQEFQASLNGVDRSFRTPIIGVNTDDRVEWIPMVSSSGDGEFQFLYDQIARNILSAFLISPDELPGYGHLSKGTNSQTLSESNNLFKLTAARDAGLRPLILKFEAFLNDKIFPIIDPELAQLCYISISGLDAESREQESLRLQQDMPIHMTYDEVLRDVEKPTIGRHLGGEFPLNERYQVIADKYIDVGQLITEFAGDPTAYIDPLLKYRRDGFYIQNIQLLMSINPAAVHAQYSARPYAMDILKMLLQDLIDEDEE